MKKILGILGLLIVICIATGIKNSAFFSPYNIQNTVKWCSLFALISIGAAFVIITGGIDLSIGSVIGLTACLLPIFIGKGLHPIAALLLVLAICAAIGIAHGLLITKLDLQPFVVTLCGLMIYRGLARTLTGDDTQRFVAGNGLKQSELPPKETLEAQQTQIDGMVDFFTGKWVLSGDVALPYSFFFMAFLAIVASIFLSKSIWGRYMFAVGRNEEAARFSGINTNRIKIAAYVICAVIAGLGGSLFAMNVGSVQPPAFGNFYELYAIAGAVLGGCSLRGGEGTILGVIIGAAVMRVLYNAITMFGIPDTMEFVVIGTVLLLGVIADELIRRTAAKRKTPTAAST